MFFKKIINDNDNNKNKINDYKLESNTQLDPSFWGLVPLIIIIIITFITIIIITKIIIIIILNLYDQSFYSF